MARRVRAVAVLIAMLLAAALGVRGAFALMDRGTHAGTAVVIGTKAFSESVILGEVMAQWLERAGVPVERRYYLGGTSICFEALRSGAIDLYPEYTGTGLMAILHEPVGGDGAGVFDQVRTEFERRYDQTWLAPLGFNNAYALAMPRRTATTLGIRRISDLLRHPTLRAGFASEFFTRQDGWTPLRARYGLSFAGGGPRSMEAGLMYQAAAAGEVDVISAYSTDGRLATQDLVLLEDDRRFFPPYEAAAVVRRPALARWPVLARMSRALAGRIDDARMRRMNAEVDSGRKTPAEVARTLLDEIQPHPLP